MYHTIPGIYKITCVVENKSYIGSSINIIQRLTTHKAQLKYNKHENRFLQTLYNNYGINSFQFVTLEIVWNMYLLISIEDRWIEEYKAELVNIKDKSTRPKKEYLFDYYERLEASIEYSYYELVKVKKYKDEYLIKLLNRDKSDEERINILQKDKEILDKYIIMKYYT